MPRGDLMDCSKTNNPEIAIGLGLAMAHGRGVLNDLPMWFPQDRWEQTAEHQSGFPVEVLSDNSLQVADSTQYGYE
jgi:hypothetical protein